ncbi:MAG: hypothetical protein IAG10_18735 [Planctomycetaceae bacterium]|nr:hypothetical protein [Planctomycetaceae bacterium]
MSDRDDCILAHIGLYHLSLRPVIEELFFEGRNCGNVIQRLVAAKQLQSRDGLPGRLSYYQLSRGEANRRGLPASRARPPQNQALHTALAVLWFCTMSGPGRHRLEPAELDRAFPQCPPNGIHCIERDRNTFRLFRMKVTDPTSDDAGLLRSLRKSVFETADLPGLRPWMQTGRYCFAILTETETRVQRIRELIQADEQLVDVATFIVEQAPGVRTLNQALHERQPRSLSPKLQCSPAETENLRRQP